ncbi:MAG: hypothetical protein EBT65_01620 [Actinobacteria bacterium]|jgi:hypothetical protein|nr:hypothetical protein [Actinomycetota bacterium]
MAKRNPMTPVGIASSLPNGTAVADFSNYLEAVAYVDRILRGNFPATAIAIVGTNLSTVERVRSRINYSKVAINGAMTGSWLGLLVFLIFGTSTEPSATTPLFSLGSAILVGAGFGMLWQVIRFSLAKSKRSFASGSLVVASKYEVVVPSELTSEASEAFVRGGQAEA